MCAVHSTVYLPGARAPHARPFLLGKEAVRATAAFWLLLQDVGDCFVWVDGPHQSHGQDDAYAAVARGLVAAADGARVQPVGGRVDGCGRVLSVGTQAPSPRIPDPEPGNLAPPPGP